MSLKKNTSLLLSLIMCLSIVCGLIATITTNSAKADSITPYYQTSLSELHSKTCEKNEPSANTKADITVLTHGLNSGSYAWSNTGSVGYFAYNKHSIIEQIRSLFNEGQTGDNVSLFTVSVDSEAIPTPLIKTKEERQSRVLTTDTASGDVEATNLGGIYTLTNVGYNYSGYRDLTINKYTLNGSIYSMSAVIKDDFLTTQDVQNHIIIVFESTRHSESNDVVYSELEYILDSISWEYNNIAQRLPKFNLIGHSRGGLTNMQYALAHPNNVVSMYSLGTPFDSSNFGQAGDYFLDLGELYKETEYKKADGTIEVDYSPGVLDLLSDDLLESYTNCWNDNYSDYDHIKFTPIGTYVTLGFVIQTLIDHVVQNNEIARGLLKGVAITTEVVTGILSLFCPTWFQAKIVGLAIDTIKDIIREYVDINSPWLEIVSGIRLTPVNEEHISLAFSFSLVYEDDLFIDLESQLAREYQGTSVKRKAQLMDSFDQIAGQNLKARPDAVGVAHNLETMNEDIVGFIASDVNLGATSVSSAFKVRYANGGCYITELTNPNLAMSNGVLTIPSQINGYSVLGIDSLMGELQANSTSPLIQDYDLTQIVIPATVEEIGEYAFCGLSELITVSFDGNSALETVGEGAFGFCTALTSCVLPNSVKTLGKGAFAGCTALATFNIGASVEMIGTGCFVGSGVSAFTVNSANANYSAIDGVLFDNTQTILVAYPSNKISSSYAVPSTVLTIGEYSFFGNTNLQEVFLQDVDNIRRMAFANCINLEKITGDSVTAAYLESFENTAWYNQNKNNEFFKIGKVLLKYNGIAQSLDLREFRAVESYAFVQEQESVSTQYSYNTTLNSVTIGLISDCLSENIFYNCSALESIYIVSTEKTRISKSAFNGISEDVKVYVQLQLVEEYSQEFENVEFCPIKTKVNFYSGGEKVHEEYAYYGEFFKTSFVPDCAIGYRFIGWYNTEEYNSSFVNIKFDLYESEVNLYAKIEEGEYYSIEYNYNIDEKGAEGRQYKYGDTIELITVSYPGYNFLGWYWDEDCTVFVDESELIGIYGDLKFYAKWEYTAIEFISPVGNSTDGGYFYKIYYNIPSLITLGSPILTHGDAQFYGWYDGERGTGNLIIDTQGNILVDEVPSILYAGWETFTITYVYNNDGVQTVNNPTTYSYYDGEIELLEPLLIGRSFIGWYQNEKKYTHLSKDIHSDLILNAEFTKIYTINFEVGEGTSCDSINVEVDGTFTLPTTEKTGYHHQWSYNNQVYLAGQTLTFNSSNFDTTIGEITFVSIWTHHEDYDGLCTYRYMIVPNNLFYHHLICNECGYTETDAHDFKLEKIGDYYKCSKCNIRSRITPVIKSINGVDTMVYVTEDGQEIFFYKRDDEIYTV